MPAPLRVDSDALPADVADELEAFDLPGERLERWRLPRNGYRPTTWVARDADGIVAAAALTSGRPATAAVKIVDVWWRDRAAAVLLVDAVVERSRSVGDVAVKWEVPAGAELPAFAAEQGFMQMRRPWAAVGTEAVGGFVRWLAPAEHDEPGYYAQTTLFTCGAVAALIASEGSSAGGFSGGEADRDAEVGFWRRASNYPACEPVGLAVALHDHLVDATVEVALDIDGPALLEGLTGFDRSFRAELQDDSLRQAGERGMPVRRDRVAVSEIARRVDAGEQALLLIDEAPMHGESGPHWIVAHARVGDAVIVEDPWISVEVGETWVDTHEMPVRPEDLDRLVRWSADAYRGVVFVAK
ncbi:peptidase C39 family protein [Microbacterium allomyrinae]|uniref:Peptidase C39 family protein n=1 Tax=Microbacterium allomyrinae TaxID=2830666 RepID=A0A9X1LXK2_9MICO|nr:peptidase C39 family protein [Microbacterium allomyrinae]MCC2033954.1 peptidase C39 family protein [Microbacterium allomyrinae]